MLSWKDKAKRYELRAEECMSISALVKHPETKAQYQRIAETYIQMQYQCERMSEQYKDEPQW